MAFQEFSHFSERRKAERREKLRKRITIAVASSILLLGLIAAGCFAVVKISDSKAHNDNNINNNNNAKSGPKEVSATATTIKLICNGTDYKQSCENSLSEVAKTDPSLSQPQNFVKAAISDVETEVQKATNETSALNFDTPEEKAAYEDCKVLLQDAMDELKESLSRVELGKLSSASDELNNWLSAVMSYLHTCIDGFPEGNAKISMEKALKSSKELTSNGLAIVSEASSVRKTLQLQSGTASRRLLAEDSFPQWLSHDERRMLKARKINKAPNVIVAKDGSGNFTTISDALAAMPEKYEGRYLIYVKEGVYEETVIVTKKMVNVTMWGEGSQKTIVTGSKNFVDGVRTFQTATFAALGDGFIANSMGFRNTAGPQKHQAVALRVQADKAVFSNCRMEGYQDTLYAQTHRQFYRSCVIMGTVDFIFGDASAIFQNCLIVLRKPMDNQQNIITAQGRTDKRENTGIVLQACRIQPDKDLVPGQVKSYLGRPWKEFSRTIVMESTIGDLIQPEGWLPWEGDFALKTLFYAEYNNKGPGASVAQRVKWPGYNFINKQEAFQFTVGPFLQGESWLKDSEFPVRFGFYA